MTSLYLSQKLLDRNATVMKALAALGEYARQRREVSQSPSDWVEMEVFYNIGRSLHHLGLINAAIPYYEHALSCTDPGDPRVDLRRDAALCLQRIYIAAGQRDMALDVTRRFLTL